MRKRPYTLRETERFATSRAQGLSGSSGRGSSASISRGSASTRRSARAAGPWSGSATTAAYQAALNIEHGPAGIAPREPTSSRNRVRAEEDAEREADRHYWAPLKQELEQLRHAR